MKGFTTLLSILAFLMLLFVACENTGKSNLDRRDPIIDYEINDNNIKIRSKNTNINNFSISYNGISGTKSVLFSKTFDNKIPNVVLLDIDQILKSLRSQRKELAYELTINESLPLIITINNANQINFEYHFSKIDDTGYVYVDLIRGQAEPLVKEGGIVEDISSIRKWLYDHGRYLDEEKIKIMYEIYKSLYNYSSTTFCLNNISSIPRIKDLSDIKYRINTNMEADYYYLYASDNSEDIKSFIREAIGNNFKQALSSTKQDFNCYSSPQKNGLLTISLIGIDKEWNRQIIPIGMIIVDNEPPYIRTENESRQEESYTSVIANTLARNGSSYPVDKQIIASNNYRKTTNNFTSLGFKIQRIPDIYIRERVTVKGVEFRGNHAQFSIRFANDVRAITFKYKNIKHKVNLQDKKSPYAFDCTLPLNLGDNYIEIFAEDKLGNSIESLKNKDGDLANFLYQSYFYIKMVRNEAPAPLININNNINIDILN